MQDDKSDKQPPLASYSTKPSRLPKTPNFNRPKMPSVIRRILSGLPTVIILLAAAFGDLLRGLAAPGDGRGRLLLKGHHRTRRRILGG